MSIELQPELKKPYLKLLGEAICHLNEPSGSLRKDIWAYLYHKYEDMVDYRDFLLALRDFIKDGKMTNNEGYFTIHKEVLQEIKEKTPTPVFKPSLTPKIDASNGGNFLTLMTKNRKKALTAVPPFNEASKEEPTSAQKERGRNRDSTKASSSTKASNKRS